MPLPASWTLVTVTGKYTNRDGTPASGWITFESRQLVVVGGEVIVPKTITVELDGTGYFTQALPSTNDPDLSATGWAYRVTEHLDNGGGRPPFLLEVPYTVSTLNLVTAPHAAAATVQAPVSTGLKLTDVGVTVASQSAVAAAQAAADAKVATADLASTAAGKGAALVGYGATTVKDRLDNLSNVDNTSDANKPISTATQTALNAKEPSITAGTAAQYWRGDKAFQTLDKTAVGLANVDNTSDANKPVSTAQQTALDAKVTSSALAANTGAGLVGHIASGAGTVARTLQAKARDFVHIRDFAGGDGISTTDATAAFQAAVAALPARGGTVYLDPEGVYKLTGSVSYNKPVMWVCERGHADISTNTNGGDAERPLVSWGGTSNAGAMLEQKPASVGTALWGGGVDGITFDGSALIGTAYHLDNARYARVRGKARNCTAQGLQITSASGTTGVFSKKVHVIDWEYVYGVSADCANSHGIRIFGNGTTVPATQHKIDRVFALIKHGAALCIEETDNCLILSAQAVGDSGAGGGGGAATGCTVLFRNIGSTVSYNNTIVYAAGEIRQENGCFGNRVLHLTSEGSGITQVSGTGTWHGTIVNYTSGSEAYHSHSYPLRKVRDIPVAAMAGGVFTTLASKWATGSMPESGNTTWTAIIPIDADMSDGFIESVEVLYGSPTGATGDYLFIFEMSTESIGQSAAVVTPEVSVAVTAAVSVNSIAKVTPTFAELAYTKGQLILLNVTRIPADAIDTSTTEAHLVGLRIRYRSSGPAGTTGLYVPTWGMA